MRLYWIISEDDGCGSIDIIKHNRIAEAVNLMYELYQDVHLIDRLTWSAIAEDDIGDTTKVTLKLRHDYE